MPIKREFGTIYIRNQPVPLYKQYYRYKNKPELTLGNTVEGMSIEWIEVNGLYISTKTIVKSVTWLDLDRNSLIFGKEVNIDGRRYLARVIKDGSSAHDGDEWGEILDACKDDDAIWHWDSISFWCQGHDPTHDNRKTVRGGTSARSRCSLSADVRLTELGWRPVLEPLGMQDISALLGSYVVARHNSSTVYGLLETATDYELILTHAKIQSFGGDFAMFAQNQPDGSVIIDREMADSVCPGKLEYQ